MVSALLETWDESSWGEEAWGSDQWSGADWWSSDHQWDDGTWAAEGWKSDPQWTTEQPAQAPSQPSSSTTVTLVPPQQAQPSRPGGVGAILTLTKPHEVIRAWSPERDLLAPILETIYGIREDRHQYLVIDSGASVHACFFEFALDYPLYQQEGKVLVNAQGGKLCSTVSDLF